jgi:hypothetical protein
MKVVICGVCKQQIKPSDSSLTMCRALIHAWCLSDYLDGKWVSAERSIKPATSFLAHPSILAVPHGFQ